MTFFKAILLGAVQGLTEFLPISSSGHLAIMHGIFGEDGANLSLDVMLHCATLFAVAIVYYKEIFALVPAFFKMLGKLLCGKAGRMSGDERLALGLSVATLPLVFAVFVSDLAESAAKDLRLVGILLMINGFVLLLGDKIGKKKKSAREINPAQALCIGGCQLLAVFPGLSRSGMTVSGGLAVGLEREEAVKFSFLLSIPAILGAALKSVTDIGDTVAAENELLYLIAAMISAAIFGIASLKFIKYLAKKKNFGIFAYYCMAAGAATVILGR